MPKYDKTLEEKMSGDMLDYLGYKEGKNPDDQPIHKDVKESLELLEHYYDEREKWALKFKEAEEFRNGVQWTKKQTNALKSRGHSPIVVNRIHPAIETAKALLTSKKPQFRATARDDSDREIAKVFSDLFQWIWEQSNGNAELKRAIDDYYVGGMGVLMAYQDPNADMGKGEVMLKSIYPLDLYIDPNSRDPFCRDAANMIVAKLMTDDEAEKVYPEYKHIWEKAGSSQQERYPSTDLHKTEDQLLLGDLTTDDTVSPTKEYIERYTRIKVNYYHIYDPYSKYEALYEKEEYQKYVEEAAVRLIQPEGEDETVTDYEEVKQYIELMNEMGPVFHQIMNPETGEVIVQPGEEGKDAIPGSTREIVLMTKGDLIEAGEILVNNIEQTRIKVIVSVGSMLLYTRILPVDTYPIIPMMNVHNRNPYPESDVRIYKPLQKYINKIRSLIIAHATTSTNVKLLIPRGSVNKTEIQKEWGKAGTAVIEFDAELGAPVVAGPVPLPNELYKNEADAKHDLEYGFGIFEMMQGSGSAAPSTYRGTVAIDEYGQRRIKSRLDDVENTLNALARVTIGLIQQLYTEEKVIRLTNPDGTVNRSVINEPLYEDYTMAIHGKVNDITVGKYDIVIASGSTLPSNRWAQFEYYMELYKSGVIDQEELLKKTEVVDVEGVLSRHSIINQLQGQLEQAQQQIKELTGDLQTADRESVHAKKRLEVEKFKTQLDKASNKIDKTSELFDARMNDQMSMMRSSNKEKKKDE